MAELQIDWTPDGDTVSGHTADLPHALVLIVPAAWGKVDLRVYHRGEIKYERQLSDVDAAKTAAKLALRLLLIRETAA